MKPQNLLYFAICLFCIVTICSCKTTEANYRAAYEIAKEKSTSDNILDNATNQQMLLESISSRLIVDGDSIPLKSMHVKISKGCGNPNDIKKYCIAVAEFKMAFNAKSMMNRLRSKGYDTIVVENGDPTYYVIASKYSTPKETKTAFQQIIKDKNIITKTPFPYVIQPIGL